MTAQDILVPVEGGTLGVMDFGGTGDPVLLVHSPGHSAATWVLLAPLLVERHRVLALDLRGHGHSQAPQLPADAAWADVATVIEALDLGPTILVGHDHGAFLTGHAAIERPELVRALITVDGNAVLGADETLEMLQLAVDPALAEAMAARFNLGRIAHTPQERDEMIATSMGRYGEDWLLADADQEGLRAEVERSLVPLPDGTWLHTPAIDDLLAYYRFDYDSSLWPRPEMYGMVRQPILVLHCREGSSADHYEDLVALLAGHDHVSLRVMEAGHMPHQSSPEETAELIEDFTSKLPPLP